MGDQPSADLRVLQAFVVQLGAAMNAAGEPVYAVQERLGRVAVAYGSRSAQISAFPTFMMVTMGQGEPVTLEIASSMAGPRLDQIAALDRLVLDAEHADIDPAAGLVRLIEIDEMRARFGPVQSIIGYAVLTLGICLILQPTTREVVAAAGLGAVVGLLRWAVRSQPQLQVLVPIGAAFCISAISAFAVEQDLAGPGLRAMVASLVVFLPGAALTTAVLELAAGQMVSGASRLVSGIMQLAFLAFGIIAGISAVGVSSSQVFQGAGHALGPWAPGVGVLVFAVGVVVANSAPARSLPALLIVLYAAWIGQVVGNALLGAYVSAFVGALVMTPVAKWAARLQSAMPPQAAFLPAFWLLVPGALGLIGLTRLAGDADLASTEDLVNTVVSIFAVALGVLCGSVFLGWTTATRRVVGSISAPRPDPRTWHRRKRPQP